MPRNYDIGENKFGLGALTRLGSTIYGVSLPMWYSLKALKTPSADDDSQWLTYWVIFGLMLVIEKVFYILVYYMPVYYELKIVFLAYLIHMNGAQTIYVKLVDPYFHYVQDFFENPEFRNKIFDKVKEKIMGLKKLTEKPEESKPEEQIEKKDE